MRFACSLCGVPIRPSTTLPSDVPPWYSQFRALVQKPSGFGSLELDDPLTGLGLYSELSLGFLTAPFNPAARWDDPRHPSQPHNPDYHRDILADNIDTRSAFLFPKRDPVFHNSCLSLLGKFALLDKTSLRCLYHVCHSLTWPLRGAALSWGHDYGGAIAIDDIGHYPWEDRSREHSALNLMFIADPFDSAYALRILAEQPEQPPISNDLRISEPEASSQNDSIFAKLPPEVILQIAGQLSTTDLLATREASRAFQPIFYYQSFWATRFVGFGERSWFFEALESRPGSKLVDWRDLFRRTQSHRLSFELKNRERIWKLFHNVPEYIGLHWSGGDSEFTAPKSEDSAGNGTAETSRIQPPTGPREKLFTYHVQQPNGQMCFAVKNIEDSPSSQIIPIPLPNSIAKISAYLVGFGDGVYISGLKFTHADEETTHFGYCSTKEDPGLIWTGPLYGLVLGVGAGGVRAMRCVDSLGQRSQWLGDPQNCAITERLVIGSQITALEAVFDGCKLTSLSLPAIDGLVEINDRKEDDQSDAYWYPEVPDSSRFVNIRDERWFPRGRTLGFSPFLWADFGGSGGWRLRHLRNVRVIFGRIGIAGISFSYEPSSQVETQTIGRYYTNRRIRRGYEESIDFSIDGAHGEAITTIELVYYYPPQLSDSEVEYDDDDDADLPIFWTCRFGTNKGRSSCTLPEGSEVLVEDCKVYKASVEPNTVITGIYAEQLSERGRGLSPFGVISEKIDMEHEMKSNESCEIM